MRLENRTAIVTGAASGIGRAIAERFAAEGAKVAIADVAIGAAEEAAAAITAKGGTAIAVAMDVADEAAVNGGVAQVVEAWGRLDIAVSNAGIQIVHPVEEFSFAEWKRMLAIHLDGAFLLTRAAIPHMYSQKHGRIIYMGSVHSKTASLLKAPYITAKHGLLGLTRAVAREGAPKGVTANLVAPGFVLTQLVRKQIPEQAATLGISEDEVVRKVMLKDTADGEFTTVDDIADVTLFFAAYPNAALTGQSLIASHGWHME
ncbi:3-hydroxybutyrate dehydrogenase [Elioraea sp.]|uniref:3-hydroxybutyrate dehydrogenase n=1 Tax=Elioraea sp. TaxID=2185103 RepID=UPI0025C1FABE|nr:3-hydroxybutyrate dehydrogenase [Elioraea sp.]